MKHRMNINLGIVLALAFTLCAVTSCLKDDDDTIVFEGGSGSSNDVEDTRIDNVVPSDIQERLGGYITIYRGTNPPNIEGAYLIEDMKTVYCTDEGSGGFSPGTIVASRVIRFTNQNSSNNTLDYEAMNKKGENYAYSRNAYVSGSGSNFTAYFNTTGTTDGVQNKTALVISGRKTNRGIENIRYAFVMVSKGYDPKEVVMDEGGFRVFKDDDDVSVPTAWTRSSVYTSTGETDKLPRYDDIVR